MKERNYGIDLLRMLSMFMICVLHISGQGDIIASCEPLSLKYWVAYSIKVFAYCSVDCFAIISGYVMFESKTKISKIIELWFQISFYAITITIIMCSSQIDLLNVKTIENALFPISTSQYWYLSSYFGLFVFIPILNLAINNLTRKQFKTILLSLFVMICIFSTLFQKDPYGIKNGYSLLWLSILYLVGGYLGKYKDTYENVKKIKYNLGFVIIMIMTFASKYILATPYIPTSIKENILVSYTSPTIFLASILLFVYFLKLNIKGHLKSLVKILSPAALGVYIIHTNPLIYDYLIDNISSPLVRFDAPLMGLYILLTSFCVYLLCSIIDIIRIHIFKLFKINKLSKYIANKIFKEDTTDIMENNTKKELIEK